jgi:hypothetical protein
MDHFPSLWRRTVAAGVLTLAAWLLAGSETAAASNDPARLHRYTVSIDESLTAIDVRACFTGTPPLYLVSESLDAAGALDTVTIEGTRRRVEPNGAELKLGALPEDSCVAYRTDLTRAQGRHERTGAPLKRVGQALVTELGIWFWRPQSLEPDEDIEVRFELPAAVSASAPWRSRLAEDGARVYRVGHSPNDWPAKVVFGRFAQMQIDVPGAVLRVALLEGAPAVEPELVRRWLTQAATAVTTLYGKFPVPEAQVVVVPNAPGNEPVPWAYVLRGGAPAVHFFINQRHPLSEFMTDWTAVHELSHMLLPYIRPEDAWLSEGAASYYQYVLSARAGMIPAGEAWQRLHDGFRRAKRSLPGVTLAEATEQMFRNGAFMRVYWEGAALLLLADERLRRRSGGAQSLDRALERLQQCCLSPDVGWDARALFAKLDEITGDRVFGELYEAHVGSTEFPRLAETYQLLGLAPGPEDETIRMLDAAPGIAFRDAIMGAPGSTPN